MTSTSRSARLAKWLSVPVGLVISALLIWQASYAAFTSEVEVAGELKAAEVTLDLEGVGESEITLNASNLVPGQAIERTVMATYSGSVDADVSFYAVAPLGEDSLAHHLNLQITGEIPAGTFGIENAHSWHVDENLAQFVQRHGEANRYEAVARPGDSVTLKFVISLPESDDNNEAMGKDVTVRFVGEATSQPVN